MIVKFMNEECILTQAQYGNGRIALSLVCKDGSPMATASVNIPEYPLPKDHVIIKDYSENVGMFMALKRAGVVGEPRDYAQSGWVSCPVCKLLINDDYTEGEDEKRNKMEGDMS